MCEKSFVSWCCVFLFFALSTNSMRNFTNDNKRDNNSTIELQFHANFTKKDENETNFNRYNLIKNFTIDNENAQYKSNDLKYDNLTQNKLSAHYAMYYKNINRMPVKRETNFTEVDNKDNFDNNEHENGTYKIVPYETCHNSICIRLCCDNRTDYDNCTPDRAVFPNIRYYRSDSRKGENKKVDEVFQLSVFPSQFNGSCQNRTIIITLPLYEAYHIYYEYIFFKNGTLYFPYFDEFVELSYYCLASVEYNEFNAVICVEAITEIMEKERNSIDEIGFVKEIQITLFYSCSIISMLCMLIIFLTYSILPELQNVHSFMLRRYNSLIFTVIILNIIIYYFWIKATSICDAMAFFRYFCFVANNLWFSVMSFDMWYNFRDIRLLQRKVKQEKKKKYIYSIFVWGSSFILTVIIIIINYAPGVPEIFRPNFSANIDCSFNSKTAKHLYDYVPSTICDIISVCLSIYTALKIARYEKDTAFVLKNTESQCYNENKKRFNLYLKFFIVLFIIRAIRLILYTILEFCEIMPYSSYAMSLQFIYVLSYHILLETFENISMLIIFVCKKKIGRLLLKRFCQNHFNHRSVFKIWTHSGCRRLEQVHHDVKNNFSTQTYRTSETST